METNPFLLATVYGLLVLVVAVLGEVRSGRLGARFVAGLAGCVLWHRLLQGFCAADNFNFAGVPFFRFGQYQWPVGGSTALLPIDVYGGWVAIAALVVVGLLGFVTRQAFDSREAGLLAAWLFASSPFVVRLGTSLYEGLFLLCALLGALLHLRHWMASPAAIGLAHWLVWVYGASLCLLIRAEALIPVMLFGLGFGLFGSGPRPLKPLRYALGVGAGLACATAGMFLFCELSGNGPPLIGYHLSEHKLYGYLAMLVLAGTLLAWLVASSWATTLSSGPMLALGLGAAHALCEAVVFHSPQRSLFSLVCLLSWLAVVWLASRALPAAAVSAAGLAGVGVLAWRYAHLALDGVTWWRVLLPLLFGTPLLLRLHGRLAFPLLTAVALAWWYPNLPVAAALVHHGTDSRLFHLGLMLAVLAGLSGGPRGRAAWWYWLGLASLAPLIVQLEYPDGLLRADSVRYFTSMGIAAYVLAGAGLAGLRQHGGRLVLTGVLVLTAAGGLLELPWLRANTELRSYSLAMSKLLRELPPSLVLMVEADQDYVPLGSFESPGLVTLPLDDRGTSRFRILASRETFRQTIGRADWFNLVAERGHAVLIENFFRGYSSQEYAEMERLSIAACDPDAPTAADWEAALSLPELRATVTPFRSYEHRGDFLFDWFGPAPYGSERHFSYRVWFVRWQPTARGE